MLIDIWINPVVGWYCRYVNNCATWHHIKWSSCLFDQHWCCGSLIILPSPFYDAVCSDRTVLWCCGSLIILPSPFYDAVCSDPTVLWCCGSSISLPLQTEKVIHSKVYCGVHGGFSNHIVHITVYMPHKLNKFKRNFQTFHRCHSAITALCFCSMGLLQ